MAVAVAMAAYRLSSGPVNLDFLSPYIQTALGNPVPGFSLTFDHTILTWAGWRRTLDIRVRGVRIADSTGEIVATVPEVDVGLSAWALIRGFVAPTRLEFISPRLHMVRLREGGIVLGLEGTVEEGAGGSAGGDLLNPKSRALLVGLALEILETPQRTQTMGFLRQVSIVNADLTIYDQPTGTVWRAPGAYIDFQRDDQGISGAFSAAVHVGEQRWGLEATGIYDNRTRTASIKVRFAGVEPAVLAAQANLLEGVEISGLPLSGTLDLEFLVEDTVARAAPIVGFDVTMGAGSVAVPGRLPGPVPISSVHAQGQYDLSAGAARLDHFSISAGDASATGAGTLVFAEEGLGLDLKARVTELPFNDLGAYWPLQRNPPAREWFTENLRDGKVIAGLLEVAIEPGDLSRVPLPEGSVVFDFSFEDLRLRYMRTLPPITGISGTAKVGVGSIVIKAGGGRSGTLRVEDGEILITGLATKHKTARVDFVVTGPTREALELIDNPPLGFPGKMGIVPATVGGASASRVRLDIPLKRKLNVREIRYAVAANLERLSMPTFLKTVSITDGRIQIKANNAGMETGGEVLLNGVPLDLAWSKDFKPSGPVDGQYTLSGMVDGPGREALGIRTADDVKGPVSGVLELFAEGSKVVSGKGFFDLSETALSVPAIYWNKPAGEPANLTYEFHPGQDGGLTIDSFEAAAGDLTAVGRVEFDREMRISRIDLGRLVFGENDLSLEMRWNERDGYVVAAGGKSYDLRPALNDIYAPETTARKQRIALSARVARLVLAGGRELRNVDAYFVHTGVYWQQVQATGSFPDGAKVAIRITPKNGGRSISVTAGNAGSVGAGFDVFPGAEGGKLALRAEIDDTVLSRPVIGRLMVDKFKLLDMPLLAQVLTVASLTGIADLMSGDGVSIDRLDVKYALEDGVLKLKDARASGPAIGFTLDGILDRGTGAAEFSGTIVPAYSLNSALGNVPLVGGFLVPGKGEGLFAMNYRIEGPLESPKITVNPLTALAPGFLRKIFAPQSVRPAVLSNGNGRKARDTTQGAAANDG